MNRMSVKFIEDRTKHSNRLWLLSICGLVAIAIVAFLWQLGTIGLVDETEPLFAEAARQMTVTGNWITPYFNGETRFDKPPLIYWLMTIGFHVIGTNEWAVRLPSAIAAIVLMVGNFVTLQHFGYAISPTAKNTTNSKNRVQLWLAATISTALLALNILSIVWGRTGVSDMLLSGCMGTALFCFFWGYVAAENPRQSHSWLPNGWYLAFYILIALAVLTKGPIGLVVPGGIIGCFAIYIGKFKAIWREMQPIKGLFLILLLTVPWYVLVILENGQTYIDSFFGYHNFQRFTEVVNGHDAPWYFYFLIVFGLFAPWSVYLPVALSRVAVWRRKFWQYQPRRAQLGVFACWWFIFIFGFFSISVTKLPSYVLPLIPAAAILVALLWSEALSDRATPQIDRGLSISMAIHCGLLVVLALVFWYSPEFVGKDPVVPNLGDKVAASGLPWRGMMVWGIVAISSIFCWLKVATRKWFIWLNIIGFVAFIGFVLHPTYFWLDRLRQLPLRELASEIVELQQPDREVWMLGFNKPSLVFYTRRSIDFFKNRDKLNEYFQQDPDLATKDNSVLIVSRNRDLKKIGLYPEDYQELDYRGVYKLVRTSIAQIKVSLEQANEEAD
jgi:4-amino-4-deoxy-L-arabinose transferase-like glycosyltransferase